MALFGLKKKKEVKEAKDVIKELEKTERQLEKKMPEAESMPEKPVEQKPSVEFAPLFVRINKYKQILHTMNYLKTTVSAVKGSISILKELDKLREENLKMVEDAVGKVEKRLMTLDSSFMRPSGFSEEIPQFQNIESLGVTLNDLRDQINQLKSQIATLA